MVCFPQPRSRGAACCLKLAEIKMRVHAHQEGTLSEREKGDSGSVASRVYYRITHRWGPPRRRRRRLRRVSSALDRELSSASSSASIASSARSICRHTSMKTSSTLTNHMSVPSNQKGGGGGLGWATHALFVRLPHSTAHAIAERR